MFLKLRQQRIGLLSWTLLFFFQITGSVVAQSDDESRKLQEFAISASSPETGINRVSLHLMPTSAAYAILWLATENSKVAKELGLDANQLAKAKLLLDFRIDSKEENFQIHDETRLDPKIYDFLREDQKRTIELFGLRVDGCAALTRTFFVKTITLDEATVNKINSRILTVRTNRVKPRLQKTFGAQSRLAFADWESTKDSIQFNLSVISLLSAVQKKKLIELVDESKPTQEICDTFYHELFK